MNEPTASFPRYTRHAEQRQGRRRNARQKPGKDRDRTMQPIDPDYDQNTKALIAAVIQQARWETIHGKAEQREAAREWLLSDGQVWLDAIADVHPDKVRQWLDGARQEPRQPDPDRWKAYQKPRQAVPAG